MAAVEFMYLRMIYFIIIINWGLSIVNFISFEAEVQIFEKTGSIIF